MALQSPGVQVSVIDESFYTPAEPGTTPLIVVATAQDKSNAAGTGIASATTKANAGKAFKMTSQKDLVDLFGVPFFEKTASASPIHGGERNEYGLLAAYSLLGVSNAAFIVRADVDLAQLEGQAVAPGALPTDGQWWIDTQNTVFGIQEWNGAKVTTTGGQKFATKTPIVLTDDNAAKIEAGEFGPQPLTSVGAIGDYAVVLAAADDESARIYYKTAGNGGAVLAGSWVLVGSADWKNSIPTVISSAATTSLDGSSGSFTLNGATISAYGTTVVTLAAAINSAEITGVFARGVASSNTLYLYTDGTSESDGITADGGIKLTTVSGTALATLGITSAVVFQGPTLQQTPHTQVPQWKSTSTNYNNGKATGSVWIKTTEPNNGARWRAKRWSSATESWVAVDAPLYATGSAALFSLDRVGGGKNIPLNNLFVQTNAEYTDNATFKVWRRMSVGNTIITSAVITGSSIAAGEVDFKIAESTTASADLSAAIQVKAITVSGNATANANAVAGAINAAGFTNIEASVTTDLRIQIFHKLGGDFQITDIDGQIASLFTGSDSLYALTSPTGDSSTADYLASNWEPLSVVGFKASGDAPVNEPQDGQLWYNPEFSEVDIMVHNGNTWVGYLTAFPSTNVNGPTVAASNPYTVDTVTGDIWVSTADLENYPTIYRYNADLDGVPAANRWVLVDKTDQVTEEGVLFADARYGVSGATGNTAGTIADLLTSDYLDFDAPDPALYPEGMLLWNLRRSGGNVKKYNNAYVDPTADNVRMDGESQGNYANGDNDATVYDRWTTVSANNEDGSGAFGRHAQRKVVVAALKSVVDTSSEIRDEERRNFNLIAAPGYTELLSNLVNLNIDRGLTAFVVGDTPFRLPADATSLTNWGTNAELVTDNGDAGIVTYDEYAAVFYPSGFTTDLGGSNAVVPPSHMMLKTIALSDNVSYPWFAPAGTRRGGITNATAVGYIDALSGEFQTVALNEGQRDTLYDLKVNPLTFFNGVGLVNYGQKTRAKNASALDRINVARLVVYLRSQLNKLARPYIFEPNDKITRDEIKQACESLLLELVGLRALYDFAVVCDESNNTAARIDRNELYVDIAISPVKAVEFIYIPLRVKNTGEI